MTVGWMDLQERVDDPLSINSSRKGVFALVKHSIVHPSITTTVAAYLKVLAFNNHNLNFQHKAFTKKQKLIMEESFLHSKFCDN